MLPALLVLVGCGGLVAVQVAVNATLSRNLGSPLFAFVFSLIQLLTTIPLLYFSRTPFAALGTLPPWQYVGALLGSAILIASSWAAGRVGMFVALVTWLVGQLTVAMLVDQFGLLGAAQIPVSFSRLAGLCLVIAGVWLAQR